MISRTPSPASNPGFLDTLTWDPSRAASLGRRALADGRLSGLAAALAGGEPGAGPALTRHLRRATRAPLALVPPSAVVTPSRGLLCVAVLEDGQHLFLALTPGDASPFRGRAARPLCSLDLRRAEGRMRAHLFPFDLTHLRLFLAEVAPEFAPSPPSRPGLGIGCRMGVLDLPVALQVVKRFDLCAAVIQSSVYRELAPLDDLTRLPLPEIDLPGVGRVPLGHTGMSVTGQFVAMMAERIKLGDRTPIAADADHLPLRGMSPAARRLARRLVREARDRSLFTLDPHFCLYGGDAGLATALDEGRGADLEAAFQQRISPGQRRSLLARYAGKRFPVPGLGKGRGAGVAFERLEVLDCALRFQEPLQAVEEACAEIRAVRGGAPTAVEVSIDEIPGLSEPRHFYYLGSELAARRIPLFSLAPGLGFTKLDVDVQDPRGAFAVRVRELAAIARHFGVVMGVHSGDGKSTLTRRILAREVGGNYWYKISPDRQRTFFRSLALCPERSEGKALFRDIYRAALCRVVELTRHGGEETARVARQTLGVVARQGGVSASVAAEIRRVLDLAGRGQDRSRVRLVERIAGASAREVPGSLLDGIVHNYAFAAVGERDARGRFRYRGRLLSVPEDALAIYHRLDAAYLANLTRSLGLDR
jgi:hypothetical protein